MSPEPPIRGLQAVHEGRIRRAGFPQIPPRLWLWAFVILAGWAIIYWKKSQGEVESSRNRLLSEQRAVAAELGPRFFPLREQIEKWTVEGASQFSSDFVDPSAPQSKFRARPGVYLRLLIDDARDVAAIRKASTNSLRDGFTSCLMQTPNPDPWSGKTCKHNHECDSGQHCNEVNHCSLPAQPYNLRTAYRATRVLEDAWIKDVREAGDDKRLLLLQRDFQSAVKEDIPFVIDLMTRAQFFILVLDEKVDPLPQIPDGGTLNESLQTVEHPVRVFVYDLASKKPVLKVRRAVTSDVGSVVVPNEAFANPDNSGQARPVAPAALDPQVLAAIRRQANNCALAFEVRKTLGEEVPQ